jgi:hypothetical protein
VDYLLTGAALWSYDHELEAKRSIALSYSLFSGTVFVNDHKGDIALTSLSMIFSGDEEKEIPLGAIQQIYMGFDEVCPKTAFKNFGTFWQPLRVVYTLGAVSETLYLVVDHDLLTTKNHVWFDSIQELLG